MSNYAHPDTLVSTAHTASVGFNTYGTIDEPAVWREPPSYRGNQFRSSQKNSAFRGDSSGERALPIGPKTSELSDSDFPFSALIRLVQEMRR